MSITYLGNKYSSSFPAKNTTNLYDMAQEYKKKNTDFDKSIVYDEKITRVKQLPSENVVKDIFSATGKFFSRKFLMYDTTTIKFSELQNIFKIKDKHLAFESKRTLDFLNMIYSKLKLNLIATPDLFGKKINLYFPKDTNTTWFIRKYISIESSSAPIELVEVGEVIQNDVSNYNSYNIDLRSVGDGSSIETNVNGGKIRVKKENGDTTTWIKSSYTKANSNSDFKKMGWGKIIVDLPLYNTLLIDVYKESLANASPDSTVEVAFPIFTSIEEMITNKSLFDKYNSYLFDNANFFNTALINILRDIQGINNPQFKKITDLLQAPENKVNKKKVTGLSKVMALYLGLKKAYVGILRKIRALFDAFSIKDLNRLLNAINSFNNKRNYLVKKKTKTDLNGVKSTYKEIEYLKLTDLKDYVDQKNLTLVSNEIVNSDIKWWLNKIFNLKSNLEITNAIKALSTFYNENRYLDPLNYFSTLSPEMIVKEIQADLTSQKLQNVNRDLINYESNALAIGRPTQVDLKKIFSNPSDSLTKTAITKYEAYIKNYLLKMGNVCSKILESYIIKADKDFGEYDIAKMTRYINENIGTLFTVDYLDASKILVSDIITKKIFANLKVDEDAIDEVLGSIKSESLLDDIKYIFSELTVQREVLNKARKTFVECMTALFAFIGNLEKWCFKTTNMQSFDILNMSKIPINEIFRLISNSTKIQFKSTFLDRLTDYESNTIKKSTMDLQYANLVKISDIAIVTLANGLDNFVDVEFLKNKKMEEREDNVVRNENSMDIVRVNMSEDSNNQMVIDYEENFDDVANNLEIIKEDDEDIKDESNTNINLIEFRDASTTDNSKTERENRFADKKDKKIKTTRTKTVGKSAAISKAKEEVVKTKADSSLLNKVRKGGINYP